MMAKLSSFQEVQERLVPALHDRTHWIFVADGRPGHAQMVTIALALIEHEADLDYGFIEFMNMPTQHRGMLSVLAVPKRLLSQRDLGEFLAGTGITQPGTDEQDLILMPSSAHGQELIITFVFALEKGQAGEANQDMN
jgi:hypothetical protein